MISPEVCVLKTDGINCDAETLHAFDVAGASTELVHVSQLLGGETSLDQYQALAIPGGFSYGDDIASGKVLATDLTSYVADSIQRFVDDGKPIIGICNGFQVLVRTGLLPNRTLGAQQATLAQNERGKFECRWIDLAVGQSVCKFVDPDDFNVPTLPMQIAHGEGRFLGSDEQIDHLIQNGQVVFRYARPDQAEPVDYPFNPNGSVDNIAGVCDPSGLILGMMPHPERSMAAFHPHRTRTEAARNAAGTIFRNIVTYAKGM